MSETQPLVSASARQRILEEALSKLPSGATAEETDRAIAKARAELSEWGLDATESELLRAAARAISPIVSESLRRQRRDMWIARAPSLLPLDAGKEDAREAAELASTALRDLPPDLPGQQVREKILEALAPLRESIEEDRRIRELVTHGRGRVAIVLWELLQEGAIERAEYLDVDFQHDLEQAVVEELEEELDGSETERDVEHLVESTIEAELDLEITDDDD